LYPGSYLPRRAPGAHRAVDDLSPDRSPVPVTAFRRVLGNESGFPVNERPRLWVPGRDHV